MKKPSMVRKVTALPNTVSRQAPVLITGSAGGDRFSTIGKANALVENGGKIRLAFDQLDQHIWLWEANLAMEPQPKMAVD